MIAEPPRFPVAPTLYTERLVLRAYRYADFEQLAQLYSTDRSRYIGGPLGREQVWLGFMNTVGHWPIMGFGGWAVDLAETGECIGEVAVSKPAHFPEIELGWLLFEGYEGHGYAFEAAKEAQEFAFDELGLETLVSYIDPDNAPSRRLAEKLGGVYDASAPTPNGDPTHVFRYAKSEAASAK
ncbi:GNAT family N-acetyltransferase [Pelagibacterium halotolerans]|uniref:GNAT family N-acetyltransferase n=1 Tax=Pelagibacterium halotolerans TaxID=531813 RepID=UPI00384A6286